MVGGTWGVAVTAGGGLILASLLACGGKTEAEPMAQPDRAPPGFWPSQADGGVIDPQVGAIATVPGGTVRLGFWEFDPETRAFRTPTCDGQRHLPSVKARVSAFRMMLLEVSFGLYGECVRTGRCEPPDGLLSDDPAGSGAWDDPSRVHQPAAASYYRARAFCRAFGGDLPTYAQWVRAAEGDTEAFGIKELTEAYVNCSFGRTSPLCDAVNNASWSYRRTDSHKNYRALPDVGTNAWDVGPYGHRDMFGSAAEWVRVSTRRWSPPSCGAAFFDDELYVPYEDPPPTESQSLMHIARDLWSQDPLASPDAFQRVAVGHGGGTSERAGDGTFYTGFRCAFPPAQ